MNRWQQTGMALVSLYLWIPMTYAIDGVTYSMGTANDPLQAARVSIQWDWQKPSWQFKRVTIDGYWDVSAIYWENPDSAKHNVASSTYGLAVTPVLTFAWQETIWALGRPFFELGVGMSVLSSTNVATGSPSGRRMGSRFQFEDRAVLGLIFGKNDQYEVAYQYLHHSNANLSSDNDGLDTHMLRFGWQLAGD